MGYPVTSIELNFLRFKVSILQNHEFIESIFFTIFLPAMRFRDFIIYLFLVCYAGALTHSVAPHHHHESSEELEKHSHNSGDKDPVEQQQGTAHFLSHTTNVDVLLSQVSTVKLSKVKAIAAVTCCVAQLSENERYSPPVFHPPANQRIAHDSYYSSPALRAPPTFIA
ncbi:MAG: hypothetical protein ABJH04_00060 [Cyclobacteriaceae bacterium]|jgi:hypothetical protein